MGKNINPWRVLVLTLSITVIGGSVFYDRHRVQSDFYGLKTLLIDARMTSLKKATPLVVKFNKDIALVSEHQTGKGYSSSHFPTLKTVNYDTTVGQDMIVFDGGDIELRSWLGFSKYIHVNCAGLAREGRYPED